MDKEKSPAVQQIEANRDKARLYDRMQLTNSTAVALCYMAAYLIELHDASSKKDDIPAEKKLGTSIALKHIKIVQGQCDLSKNKEFYKSAAVTTSDKDASVSMNSGLGILEIMKLEQEKAELYDGLMKNMTKIDAALCDMAAIILYIANLHTQTLEQMITPTHANIVGSTCNITQAADSSGEKSNTASPVGQEQIHHSQNAELAGEATDEEENY